MVEQTEEEKLQWLEWENQLATFTIYTTHHGPVVVVGTREAVDAFFDRLDNVNDGADLCLTWDDKLKAFKLGGGV